MKKEELFRKLASRKFWAMVGGLATSMMVIWGFPENQITQVVASIGALGAVVSYIFVEGSIDKA